MKKWMKLLCLVLVVTVLSGCSYIAGQIAQQLQDEQSQRLPVPPKPSDNAEGGIEDYSKLQELLDLIDERFIDEYDRKAVEDAAAAAIVEALGDRWSYYISADEYQSYVETMQNAYVGIGITITVREAEDGYDIKKVEENGPAAEAGILAGDILTKANGTELGSLGVDGAAAIVKGEEGTTVEITVLRDGKEMTFTVERRTIQVQVAKGQMLPGNVGLVTIANFDDRCASESKAAIKELLDQGATALIFDVRFNPGGYAHEMVELLDYLLPEGPLFISEFYNGETTTDSSGASCLELPMVVLVNPDSYSAAEFFAAAMRDYEWATIVGQNTTGKGYFQQAFLLSDGSAVNLSVGKYYTPKGQNLANIGLTPDVVVEVDEDTYADLYYGYLEPAEDPQIQAALEVLKNAN